MFETFEVKKPWWKKKRWWAGGLAVLAIIVAGTSLWRQTRPPADFPINALVTVPRGLSAAGIADLLEENKVVRSNLLLYAVLVWRYDPSNLQAGTFVFQEPIDVWRVAERLTSISGTDNLMNLTLPEGYTVAEFAGLAGVLPDFDREAFMALSSEDEGYLFPDTYYVPVDFEAGELYELLRETYAEKTEPLAAELAGHPLGEYGVLTLASLLEREANTEESMRMVSGILQNRLKEGMRLQVDASLEYVLDRPLNTLRPEDLEEIDSPYNTYRYDGLPPTPIGNPGLQAIRAVLYPIQTDHFYYLTDDDGVFHYARTFDEHRDNIAKYLQ